MKMTNPVVLWTEVIEAALSRLGETDRANAKTAIQLLAAGWETDNPEIALERAKKLARRRAAPEIEARNRQWASDKNKLSWGQMRVKYPNIPTETLRAGVARANRQTKFERKIVELRLEIERICELRRIDADALESLKNALEKPSGD
jgi:hypothetical protein